jgi:hypothetical protein
MLQYDIKHILNKDHIKHFKSINKWPAEFDSSSVSDYKESINIPSIPSKNNNNNIEDSNDYLSMENSNYNPNRNHCHNNINVVKSSSYIDNDDYPPTAQEEEEEESYNDDEVNQGQDIS